MYRFKDELEREFFIPSDVLEIVIEAVGWYRDKTSFAVQSFNETSGALACWKQRVLDAEHCYGVLKKADETGISAFSTNEQRFAREALYERITFLSRCACRGQQGREQVEKLHGLKTKFEVALARMDLIVSEMAIR